jgi:hypothetical protein
MDQITEEEKQQILNKSAVIKLITVAQILKCIEIASSRGAYQPSEMIFVGSVYDLLSKGLNDAFQQHKTQKLETVVEETIEEKN